MGYKGSWRRPTLVSREEADLRWRILEEPDPEKKKALEEELEALREAEWKWAQAKKEHKHLWGSAHEDSTD